MESLFPKHWTYLLVCNKGDWRGKPLPGNRGKLFQTQDQIVHFFISFLFVYFNFLLPRRFDFSSQLLYHPIATYSIRINRVRLHRFQSIKLTQLSISITEKASTKTERPTSTPPASHNPNDKPIYSVNPLVGYCRRRRTSLMRIDTQRTKRQEDTSWTQSRKLAPYLDDDPRTSRQLLSNSSRYSNGKILAHFDKLGW